MVTVTAADVRRVEQVERELASEGREPERVAIHKALALLRQAAIDALERATGLNTSRSPVGQLPPADGHVHALTEAQQQRLAGLMELSDAGSVSVAERAELQELLDLAEAGAMRNVAELLRAHAPDSEQYERALRAYKRSFSPPRRRGRRVSGSGG